VAGGATAMNVRLKARDCIPPRQKQARRGRIGLLRKQRLYNEDCAPVRHFRSGHFQIKTTERSFNN